MSRTLLAGVTALLIMLGSISCAALNPVPTTESDLIPPPLLDITDIAVPDLPFADNPDPTLCGIPAPWGLEDPAWLTGYYEGDLIEPAVHLYNSHARGGVTGIAPHGSRVQVIFYQQNPQLNYYLVKTLDLEPTQQGWVPAPFISFEPVVSEP